MRGGAERQRHRHGGAENGDEELGGQFGLHTGAILPPWARRSKA